MPKFGIKFDYDLLAQQHVPSGAKCQICGEDLRCRWSDYHGEGVCMTCGAPYQLINGSEEQKAEGKYPYINFLPQFIPAFKEHWEATHQFVFGGYSFKEDTGAKEFHEWLEKNYPNLVKEIR